MTFKVDLAMAKQRGRLGLMFEEGIVENPVVNIHFPHFRLDSLPHPLLQRFVGII